jgi:hypothetical protein
VIIRPASLNDTASLAFLRQERLVLLQQSDARLTAPTESLPEMLDDPHCQVLVGEREGQVVGYAVGYIRQSPAGMLPADTGLISELTLDAHKYHGGLGRQLYAELRAWLLEQQVQHIAVRVPRYHAVEQAFWRSLGAIPDDVNPILTISPALIWMIL